MHNKQYCIFNKQYTKAEYEALVPKIIEHMRSTGEWGDLFPVAFSPFGYNKTTAQMYYPSTKEEVEAKGWKWDDTPSIPPNAVKIVESSQLPDGIDDVSDDILNWAITCEVTGRPFKIVKQELQFYRQQRLPIPRRSPDQRHMDRFDLRNPRTFWKRQCDTCHKDIQTTYSPESGKTVYCEACYLQAAY